MKFKEAIYHETIKEFIKRRFPSEYAVGQIKDDVTFYQAKMAMEKHELRKAICAESSMDTALREKIWVGFSECFGIAKQELEREYFLNVDSTEIDVPLEIDQAKKNNA